MAFSSQLDQAIPPYLAPVLEDVQRRLVQQQSTAQAQDIYAPAVSQVQGQTMPPEAVMPLPPDISNNKAAMAMALSNLGAALTSASGVRGLNVDPNLAFKTVMGRRGEIRETERENAKNKGIFALEKQRTLGDLAGKQAGTAAQLGSDELSRLQRESEFDRRLKFDKETGDLDRALRKQEMDMRMALAKLEADTPEKAAMKARAELEANGLGRDVGIILGSLRGAAASGPSDGSFSVYLPVRDMPASEIAKAPKDPTTNLPMRLFTSRAAVEEYMEGNFTSLSPLIQDSARLMWQKAVAPAWAGIEKRRTEFENAAIKRADEAEKIRRQREAKKERERQDPDARRQFERNAAKPY